MMCRKVTKGVICFIESVGYVSFTFLRWLGCFQWKRGRREFRWVAIVAEYGSLVPPGLAGIVGSVPSRCDSAFGVPGSASRVFVVPASAFGCPVLSYSRGVDVWGMVLIWRMLVVGGAYSVALCWQT